MKTILGTGALGIAVMKALVESDPTEKITLVNHTGRVEIGLGGNVQIVAADVTDKESMKEIAMRSEVIFNCADFPYGEWKSLYTSTVLALAHAMHHTTAKLVFADTLNSCDSKFKRPARIRMPQSTNGKVMTSASAIGILSNPESEHYRRVAYVTAGELIGPGIQRGIFGQGFLDKLFKKKMVFFFGSINDPHAFTFITDFAKALVNVGTSADTFGQIWRVPNAPGMSLDKWIHLFEVIAERKVKMIVVPEIFVRLLSVLNRSNTSLRVSVLPAACEGCVDDSKYNNRFGSDDITYPSSIVKQTVQWYERKYKQHETE